jgi:HEAT repeat protein
MARLGIRLSALFVLISLTSFRSFSATPVQSWLDRLRSHDPRIRLPVAYRASFSEATSPETLATLLRASRDADPFVREHVAAALADLPAPSRAATRTLLRLLLDRDEGVRAQAALALAKRGPDALSALIAALQDTHDIRKDVAIGKDEQTGATPSDYAAVALSRMDAPVFPALADAYLGVRTQYAARGKGTATQPFDVEAVQLPGAYLERHRRSVTRALSPVYLRELILHIMRNRPPWLEEHALEMYLEKADAQDSDLGLLMVETVAARSRNPVAGLGKLYAKYRSESVRNAILEKLPNAANFSSRDEEVQNASLTDEQKQALRIAGEAIHDSSARVRERAAKVIQEAGQRAAALGGELMTCTGDASPAVREWCTLAAGDVLEKPYTSEPTARRLVQLLETDPEIRVRSAAAAALGNLEFSFPFVQAALVKAGADPNLLYWEHSLEQILSKTGLAPSMIAPMISQLRSNDPVRRTSTAGYFKDAHLSKEAVSALAAVLKTPEAYLPSPQKNEISFGDALIIALSGVLDEEETQEAFVVVLRAAAAQPEEQNRELAERVLAFLPKTHSFSATLQESLVAYGEKVDAAGAAPLLARAGAGGLTLLAGRMSSVKPEEASSWSPCLLLRDAAPEAKAHLVARLAAVMRTDNGAAGACAAAALAGTPGSQAALGDLLARFRKLGNRFLVECIVSPAWDWAGAALREIEGSTADPEPLAELFRYDSYVKTSGIAVLQSALGLRGGRRREVVPKVLQAISESDDPVEEGTENFARLLAQCAADPDLLDSALAMLRHNLKRQPELFAAALRAYPGMETVLASRLKDAADANVLEAMDFLERLELPSRATVQAIGDLLDRVGRRRRTKPVNNVLTGDESSIWDLLTGGCHVLANWGTSSREAAEPLKRFLFDYATWLQWCAVSALPRILPDDPEVPVLLTELALKDEDEELRVEAAAQALQSGAGTSEREFLLESIVLDQRIPEWIAKELNGVADDLRPWVGRRPKRGARPPGLPSFPWPPPRWSYLGVFGLDCPRSLVGSDGSTLEEVYQRLYRALKTVDPNFETGLFSAPGGFALLVKPERVSQDGSPLPLQYRWSEGKVPPMSLADYVAHLFTQPVGYFRAMVFVVTDREQFEGGNQALPDFATGTAVLPDEIARQTLKDKRVFALIYSWKREPGQAPVMIARELSALTHLERSGLLSALQRE